MPTTIAPTTPRTACRECAVPVLAVFTAAGQRPITLDVTPVPSGLYRLDEHGRAVRRSLVDLYTEQRAGAPTPGHDLHVCDLSAARPWWDRD